jgi:hypothetical protein
VGGLGGGVGGMVDINNAQLFALLAEQSRMMQQLSQHMTGGGVIGHVARRGRAGKPLSERVSRDPNRPRFHRGGGQGSAAGGGDNNDDSAEAGADSDMGQARHEAPNPDDTVCRFNQRCTNKDCPYAHASPAAPYTATVDVHDVCPFGAACKNWKCVGRHPSPAAKFAHQSEQDCRFFPNCQNPNCSFRHPSAPPCHNGGECQVPGCTFTHLKTKCKFQPCMNATCPFLHDEGQRGAFKDKVWSADAQGRQQQHTVDRQFVVNDVKEEIILPGSASNTHDPDGLQVTG